MIKDNLAGLFDIEGEERLFDQYLYEENVYEPRIVAKENRIEGKQAFFKC
jgi:hypothetical protein